jgi:hypothetical protein
MPNIETLSYLPTAHTGARAPQNWRARKVAQYIAAQNQNATVEVPSAAA